MFNSLSDRLSITFKQLRGKGRITESDLDETIQEIRIALLDADVALSVVRQFCEAIKVRSLGSEVSGSLNPAQQIIKIVNQELVNVLGGQTRRLQLAKNPPTVILLTGLQGAGKTTLAGKLALHLRTAGHQPVLVAADLQRPNAVDQLKIVGEQANTLVFAPEPGNGVGDPVKVTRDAIAFAKQKLHDIVIVDTAGRLAIDKELMDQLRKVKKEANPTETLLVIDAMTGQDAVNTASAFADEIGIDGVVLTKLDGDTRGGAALTIREVVKKPIKFVGTGEKLEAIDVFYPERMASRILGMGDVVSLVERAQEQFDAEESARIQKKIRKNQFDFGDFLNQLQQIKKMGNLKDLMGMIPGVGKMVKDIDISDDAFKHIEAIIHSMTPLERESPELINGTRRKRIAMGSGRSIEEVNKLLKQFDDMKKMMKQFSGGGNPLKMLKNMPQGGIPR